MRTTGVSPMVFEMSWYNMGSPMKKAPRGEDSAEARGFFQWQSRTAKVRMHTGHGTRRGNNHGNAGEASRVNGFSALSVRILGPGSVTRNGLPVALPRSRKVRALLAFLTLEPGPVS